MKKFLSFLLAAMLVLGMVGSAIASETPATTGSIVIKEKAEGYTYVAYQIFTGDVDESTLSNVQWGSGIQNADALVNAWTGAEDAATIAALLTGSNIATFQDLLLTKDGTDFKYLTGGTTVSSSVMDGEKYAYTFEDLPFGYYLIVNTAVPQTGAYSKYIVQLLKNETPLVVDAKSSVPQVEKKVKDINDSTEASEGSWVDTADHDVNDTVYFKLEGTVAADIANYKDDYYYAFHDDLSDGLTLNPDSIKVFLNSENGTDITSSFTKITSDLGDGCDFEVVCSNLKAIEGVNANSKIVVTYTATLNQNSVIGKNGNPNDVYLEFSNNPNWTGDGKPNTGKTPEDTVIVFTYKVEINKVTSDNIPLEGAEFKLEKFDLAENTWKVVTKDANLSDDDTFVYTRIDDGQYRLEETVTPEGYNTMSPNPVEFTVTAGHVDATLLLDTLTGNVGDGSVLAFTPTLEATEAKLAANVVNNHGAVLPQTGGIGTTIFYLLGSIMFIGAAMTLVVRRRADAEEV